jgi:MFS transporter, FHS family, L-fucose permease
LLVGLVSGATSYAVAFVVPAACYVMLLGFGLAARRAAVIRSDAVTAPAGGH